MTNTGPGAPTHRGQEGPGGQEDKMNRHRGFLEEVFYGYVCFRGGTQKSQKRSILLYEVYFSQKKYLLRAKRSIFVR